MMSEFSEGKATAQLDIDYEALAPNHPMTVHLAAGALAGLAEHVVMLPIDSVKTRVQSLCPCAEAKCPTPIHGIASVMRKEGWARPLRGIGAVAIGTMPAHALYFTTYEKSKVSSFY
jgi:solute carrier family 25 iron transporter 28/37